jgi:hypothetical protein
MSRVVILLALVPAASTTCDCSCHPHNSHGSPAYYCGPGQVDERCDPNFCGDSTEPYCFDGGNANDNYGCDSNGDEAGPCCEVVCLPTAPPAPPMPPAPPAPPPSVPPPPTQPSHAELCDAAIVDRGARELAIPGGMLGLICTIVTFHFGWNGCRQPRWQDHLCDAGLLDDRVVPPARQLLFTLLPGAARQLRARHARP